MNRSTLNEITMWFLTLFVGAVPLFLGGNRPLIWLGALLAIAAFSIFYFGTMILLNVPLAVSLRAIWPFAALFGAFIGYQIIQMLPVMPEFLTRLPDGFPKMRSISVAPHETVLALMRWLTITFVGFYALQVSANRRRGARFLTMLFTVACLHAILGFVLFFQFGDTSIIGEKWTYLGSLTGSFINRNTMATFLASGIVLGLAVALNRLLSSGDLRSIRIEQVARAVLLPVAGSILILIDIVATRSRMGLFVTGVGILMLVLATAAMGIGTRRNAPENKGTLRPYIVVAGALAFAGIVGMFGSGTFERLGSIDQSIDIRSSLYSQVLSMIAYRPFNGFGGGAFATAFPFFHQMPVSVDLIWDKAHSSYLALWSEYGLIFGSIPMAIIALSAFYILVRRRERRDLPALAALSVIILAAVHALVDFSLEIEGYTLYFVVIVGCGLARVLTITQTGSRR